MAGGDLEGPGDVGPVMQIPDGLPVLIAVVNDEQAAALGVLVRTRFLPLL
jgi:hypothetical protein